MVVLDIGAQFAVDLVLYLALHAGVAAASEGTADFNAIHGGHDQTTRPIRVENPVAFQATSDLTAEGEDRLGRLTLQRIANGVVADRPNPLGQDPTTALGFDLQQTGYLHGRRQEDRIEHFLPGMLRTLAAFG